MRKPKNLVVNKPVDLVQVNTFSTEINKEHVYNENRPIKRWTISPCRVF